VALHTSGAQCQLAIIYYFGVAFVSTKNERAMDMLAKGGLKMERGLNTNKKERKKWRKRLGGGKTGNTHFKKIHKTKAMQSANLTNFPTNQRITFGQL